MSGSALPKINALAKPEPRWLEAMRADATARFFELGLPTSKVEAWKFTNLAPLARWNFDEASPVRPSGVNSALLAPYRLTPDCHLAVFVNGRFRPDLSDLDHVPEGTRVTDLSQATEDDLRFLTSPPAVSESARARTLYDLNTARMSGGAVVHLGPGAILDPVQLLFVAEPGPEPTSIHLRNLVQAEAGSSATVLESYVGLGEGVYWTNAVTQVSVGHNAVLRHYKLQAEGLGAYHIAETSVTLTHQASYRMFASSMGGRLGRNEIDVALSEEEAVARLAGATLARKSQHLDTTIRIDHAKARCTSSQEFKSVVDERGHAVFQGRIHVAPDAQKTDAQQVSRNLLLSTSAAVDTKPELEILADDVKCSHGATVGDLDEASLFYLRARGIDEREARRLLIDAFVAELIEHITVDVARSYFRAAFDRWLVERTS